MSLELKDVSKSYNGKKVVDNISFTMDKPGAFGLLGANGAGKTTTIRMILGIISKEKGVINWKGNQVVRENVNFGYLPEERGIYPKSKLCDQLIYFANLKGIGKKEAKAEAEYWCKKLEVYEYFDKPAEQLSKGNQQKVQLITALIHKPELLILDEPFSGLDPVNTKMIKEIINEVIAGGTYVVLSSHQMPVVEEYANEILILNKGKTVLQGNLSEIKSSYGKNNLMVKAKQDISKFIKPELEIIEKTVNTYELKLKEETQAESLLKELVTNGITIEKFELKEPSLQEIFIEKVGGNK